LSFEFEFLNLLRNLFLVEMQRTQNGSQISLTGKSVFKISYIWKKHDRGHDSFSFINS